VKTDRFLYLCINKKDQNFISDLDNLGSNTYPPRSIFIITFLIIIIIMNSYSDRFVEMPQFGDLKEQKLTFIDPLVYICAKSFFNLDTKVCNPGIEEIAAKLDCNEEFIHQSIQRLVTAGYIYIYKDNNVPCYKFLMNNKIVPIPNIVFDTHHSIEIKAIAILMLSWLEDPIRYSHNREDIPNFQLIYDQAYQGSDSLTNTILNERSVIFGELRDRTRLISVD
jgi:hypothetical protein